MSITYNIVSIQKKNPMKPYFFRISTLKIDPSTGWHNAVSAELASGICVWLAHSMAGTLWLALAGSGWLTEWLTTQQHLLSKKMKTEKTFDVGTMIPSFGIWNLHSLKKILNPLCELR